MAGIKETLEVIDLVGALGSAGGRLYADPEISLTDIISEFIALAPVIPAAIDGANLIPEEARDYDQAEIDQMVERLKEKFNIPQEQTEEAIEDHLEAAAVLAKLVVKYYVK